MKEEENVALTSKILSQGQGEKKKKKKDLLKVKCFRCGEVGHYNTQCPLRKKEKEEKKDQHGALGEIDKLSSRLQEYFSMFVEIRPGVK